jgi:sigma-B regulation protein RsbU (phosphoserine phosphatase)
MSKTLLRAVTTMTRTLARTGILPNEVLDRVNLELCRDKDKNKDDRLMFVTIFYGVLNIKTGELHYSSAGHNPPFRLSPSSGVAALQILQGGPLGIKQGRQYQSGISNLRHGEGLLLYTDGITEARNGAGSRYTEARLAEFLRQTQSHAASAIATEVIGEIKRFAGSKPPDDDMTVLALKYL